jgi:hypothetical protein
MFDNSFLARVLFKSLCALLLPACMVWGAVATWARPHAPAARETQGVELPRSVGNRCAFAFRSRAAFRPAISGTWRA